MRYGDTKMIMVNDAAGFPGSHLCEQVLARVHKVLCVDNLFTGSRHNIAEKLDDWRFEFMRSNVGIRLHDQVDEICDLAYPASTVHYQLDPVQTTKTSLSGAISLLGLAKRFKARTFEASTIEFFVGLTASTYRTVSCPLHSDDPRQRRPVIDKARKLIDWDSTIPLRGGLVRMLACFAVLLNEGAPR